MVKSGVEVEPTIENKTSSGATATNDDITLQKAIDMGEYDPAYLATFPQWHKLTRIMQWQMIMQAIKNRRRFLELSWAETFNIIDFSKKPHLKEVLKNIEKQLKKLLEDEERLRVEYSK